MPLLHPSQVLSKEVLKWKGVHLFCADFSLCSRKVQIALHLKKVSYTSHMLDIAKLENRSEFYLGVNPRGLVPSLVHDGVVVIESNDILQYLEAHFQCETFALDPSGSSNSDGLHAQIKKQLDALDDCHLDIRNLTFRFIFPWPLMWKMAQDVVARMNAEDRRAIPIRDIQVPSACGQGRAAQRQFWENLLQNRGCITDEAIKASVAKVRRVIGVVEEAYGKHEYMYGTHSFGLVDLHVFCDVERLEKCGFPVSVVFPNIFKRYSCLKQALPPLKMPVPLVVFGAFHIPYMKIRGHMLTDIAADSLALPSRHRPTKERKRLALIASVLLVLGGSIALRRHNSAQSARPAL